MSDLAKDKEEEATLLQLLGNESINEREAAAEEEKGAKQPRRPKHSNSPRHAPAVHSKNTEVKEKEGAGPDWDQFSVYPLDRGKAVHQQAPSPKAKLDLSRALGGSTARDAHQSIEESTNRQSRLDQSIKQHRHLFFGVPVEQQLDSFRSLSAISCFFDGSDDGEEDDARSMHKDRSQRAKSGDGASASDELQRRRKRGEDVDDDVTLSAPSSRHKTNGKRKRTLDSITAGKVASGRGEREQSPATERKRGRIGGVQATPGDGGAAIEKDQENKEKKNKKDKTKQQHKKTKHAKSWTLDALPHVPGLEYIDANLYKKPKLERIMGCECKEECSSCPCRGAQMECCHHTEGEDTCKCSSKCKNQRLTKGKVAPIVLVKTKKKGYGVIADATIKPRSLIIEYVGEVISETEKNRRMKRRDEEDNCYFMELYSQKVSMQRRSITRKRSGGAKSPDSKDVSDEEESKEGAKTQSSGKKKKSKSKPKTEEEIRDRKSRKGLKLACSNCRLSHLACSHESPCGRCVEKGMAASCVYVPKRRRRTYQQIEEDKRREREKEKKKREREKRRKAVDTKDDLGQPASQSQTPQRLSGQGKKATQAEDKPAAVAAAAVKTNNGVGGEGEEDEQPKVKREVEDMNPIDGKEEEELAELLCKMPNLGGLFGANGETSTGREATAEPKSKEAEDDDEYKDEEEAEDDRDSDDYEENSSSDEDDREEEEGGADDQKEDGMKPTAMTRRWYVDAAEKGNAARFINHACQPNCVVERWQCGEHMRLGVFAAVKIKKGQEITYDYAFQYDYAERDKKGKRRECHCGAASCVGMI